jgi:hypothetical protein
MTWQQQLTALHDEWYRVNRPEGYKDGFTPPCPKFNTAKTNDLQAAIILWINYSGGNATRRSTTGTPRNIGGKVILTKTKRGAADIDATYKGLTLKIEVKNKATKDTLKIEQWVAGQKTIKAGGVWFIATDMEMFVEWWGTYTEAVSNGDTSPIQPLYERPGGDPALYPTLDEWRAQQPAKPKDTTPDTNIIRAWFGRAPAFVQHTGDNRRSAAEMQQAIHSLTTQGFKVGFRVCLYYTMKPDEKVVKKLPKGYTCIDTPMQDGTFSHCVYDRNGAHALDWEIIYDTSRLTAASTIVGYKQRREVQEKFCIPEFIISENNGNPDPSNTVYIIDPKRDSNDGKLFHYIKVLKVIMETRGDKRKVKGGVMVWGSEEVVSMFKVFRV